MKTLLYITLLLTLPLVAHSQNKRFVNLSTNEVVRLGIETGSVGCFHHEVLSRVYVRQGNKLVFDTKQSKYEPLVIEESSNKQYLSKMPKELPESTIHKLFVTLNGSKDKKLTYADLKLSSKDIKAFKQLLAKEERLREIQGEMFDNYGKKYAFPIGKKINFNDYRTLIDSLLRLSNEVVHWVFSQSFGNASTTVHWRKITFTFQDKTKLVVENTDDRPNYLYTPWVVNYQGKKFKSTSIKFGELLNDLTKGAFFEPHIQDKKYAILNITNLLYLYYADQKKQGKKK
jgi:hypothetical protein